MIRNAADSDVAGILTIYNDVIATSTAVYTETPVSIDERRAWLAARQRDGLPVLVAADGSGVCGFASFGPFRPWPCYRWTVEHSVHVRADRRGQGLGRALVEALILRARATGLHVMVAGVDAANAPSLRFHARLGFREVGRFAEVGHKFGRWLDLVFLQQLLDDPGAPRA